MGQLIPGIDHDFGGGRVFHVPPLSLGALEVLQDKLQNLQQTVNALDPAAVSTVVDAAHSALKRNYPDIARADVAELVDVGNMHEVISVVLDVAGVKRKQAEAAKNQQAQAPQAGAPSGPP